MHIIIIYVAILDLEGRYSEWLLILQIRYFNRNLQKSNFKKSSLGGYMIWYMVYGILYMVGTPLKNSSKNRFVPR